MQRIIQINIAKQVIPIEEDAYLLLKDYINSLERQFDGEEGKEEIIQDIESRIAELFSIKLSSGAPSIDQADVQKVTETLGHASDFIDTTIPNGRDKYVPGPYKPTDRKQQQQSSYTGSSAKQERRLFRNPYDKMVGGVCSGVAYYFDIDPTIVRLICAFMLLSGVGLIAYLVAWAVIPMARSREELDGYVFDSKNPMDIHTMARNMGAELHDLKNRAEAMSQELRDFFRKK